jgi:hypothetical protein
MTSRLKRKFSFWTIIKFRWCLSISICNAYLVTVGVLDFQQASFSHDYPFPSCIISLAFRSVAIAYTTVVGFEVMRIAPVLSKVFRSIEFLL